MKKLLALMLALMLAIGCVSFASAEEKVTLKLWVLDSLRIEDWNTNLMTEWLEEQGGFDTIEEIMNISGIKEAVFLKIKDRIVV